MKESLLVAYGFTDLFFPIRKRDLSPLIHQSEYSMYKIFCYYSKEKPSVQISIITKGLFTWSWGSPGRWDNPLRWGNPPVHIISYFNLITFTWWVGWPAAGYLTYLGGSPTSMWTGGRFSKVPIINGPGKLSPFTLKIEFSIVLHLTW